MQKKFTFELAGRTITVETGKYAEQAGGAILISCGYTALLVCATVAKQAREGADFLPLSCDYEEKMYAAGKIPGGFIKREGRPSEKAILTSRLIDRPIRPLFPKGFYNDVQVVATAMSVERDVTPDVLAMNGASIALSISEAPFAGPIGAVSVGYVDGQYVINPDFEQRSRSRLHLTVAGTADAVMMVEAGANEISEQEMLDAILFGHEYIKQIVEWIKTIQAEVGKEKIVPVIHTPDEELKAKVVEFARAKVEWQLDTFDRKEREVRTEQVKAENIAHFAEEYPDSAADIDAVLYNLMKEILRDKIINKGIRPDGRTHTQIRPIWSEVGILPRTHGSAVFTRGQTQVMTIATLGTLGDGQTIDGIGEEEFKRYIHHYNMPPYSTGEVKRLGSPGRREIGHGALASALSCPSFPMKTNFRMRSALFPRLYPATVQLPRLPSAAARSRLWMQAFPSRLPLQAVRWVLSRTTAPATLQYSPIFRALRTSWAIWTLRLRAPRAASPQSKWTSKSRVSISRSSPVRLNRRVRQAVHS